MFFPRNLPIIAGNPPIIPENPLSTPGRVTRFCLVRAGPVGKCQSLPDQAVGASLCLPKSPTRGSAGSLFPQTLRNRYIELGLRRLSHSCARNGPPSASPRTLPTLMDSPGNLVPWTATYIWRVARAALHAPFAASIRLRGDGRGCSCEERSASKVHRCIWVPSDLIQAKLAQKGTTGSVALFRESVVRWNYCDWLVKTVTLLPCSLATAKSGLWSSLKSPTAIA